MNLMLFANNVTLILALSILYRVIEEKLTGSRLNRAILQGCLFGTISTLAIMNAWHLTPGIIFDARTVIISISGYFCGPVTALICILFSGVYRILVGGDGTATGLLTILFSGIGGIIAYYLRRKLHRLDNYWGLYLFSLFIHIGVSFLLLTLPKPFSNMILEKAGIPMVVFYPVGTVLIGILLKEGRRYNIIKRLLLKEERRYCNIFDQALAGMAIISSNGQFVEVNKKFSELVGYTSAEITTMSSSEITHPDDLAIDLDAFSRFHKGEIDHISGDKRYIRSDGEIIWTRRSLKAVFDEKGEVEHFISIIVDIGDQKANEASMRRSEEKFRILTEHSPLAIGILQDEKFIYNNSAFEKISGYSKGEILSNHYLDFIHEGDRLLAEQFLNQVENGKYSTKEIEIRGISKQGSIKWLSLYITTIEYENKPTLLIVLNDISESKLAQEELKSNEAHLRTLIETIPDLVWLKDPEGIYLSCNHRFESFFGAKRQDITGKTDYDFLDKESADFFRRHDQAAMAAGKPCINEEEVTFANDGHREILETIKTPMHGDDGRLIGVLGIGRDITWRRRAEEDLLNREQLLLGQNEALLSLMRSGKLFGEDLKEGIAEITKVCSELMQIERVSVWQYSENFLTVRCLDLYERSKDHHSEGIAFRSEDFPAYVNSHKQGQVFATSDIQIDSRVRNTPTNYWDKYNIQSFMDAPVWLHNKVGGLLSFEHVGNKREWSQADERLCATMATLISLCFETSERKQAEQALKESEERFKRALENIPDVVVIYDKDLRIRYINEATKHLTGRQTSDFIGKREEELWPPEIYSAYLPTLQKVLDTGRVCSVDIDLELPGKGMAHLAITCAPLLKENGEVREVIGITHNYTQRKRAENEIRLLSDRLRIATESAGIGVWELNLLNNHFLWDKRMYELYGLDPVNCDGTYEMWRQTIHSEDITDTEKQMEDAIANSREFHTHYRIITPGNDIRHLEMHAMIIRAPNGLALKMIGVNWDISERIHAEESIREGKAHLEEAQAFAKLGSWISDKGTQIWTWSKGMFALYNRNDAFGTPKLEEYINLLHPDDRNQFRNLYEKIQRDGESFECELRTNPVYGPELTIYTKVRCITDDGGNIVQLTGIAQDITERNKAIENLRQSTTELRQLSFAIEQISNIVVITDISGNVKYVNPKFTDVTGYTREEVLGQNPGILKSGEMSVSDYKDLWDTITNGGTWKGEFRNKKKNGELYWEAASISPVKDENGNIVGFIAIIEDITEAKKDNEERRMLEIEMDQARKLEAVGSLASGIAHEINTPIQFVGDNTHFLADSFCSLISLIDTYSELFNKANLEAELVQKKDQAEEKIDLKYIRKEIPLAVHQTLEGVERVTNIVRAMKNFAHSDQGEKAIASINDMLESTLTVARNELKYVADVITEFDESIPEIECYRDELNQVFLNLFINAAHAIADVIKGGSAEKGTIKVSTNKEGDSVIIKISDTGPGIPKSIHHRIFDQFFTTKDVGKGSGQGLAIAQKIIVEKHKGSLDFETEEGKGTTFIVRLPINVQEAVTAYE